VEVAAGDALVVYSDGVTEARNTEGVEFGVERLQDFLERASRCAPPVGICMQALRKAVRDFIGLRAIPDDQTAVMVALRAPGRETASEFELPWDLAGLEPLRHRVAEAAAALGEDASDRLVLATFEAATNVVRHVARPFSDATLSCRIERGADRVTVALWYLGLPFVRDPDAQPDFSGASEGGFGLYIIEQAVSEVRYENPLLDVCCTRLVQIAPDAIAA
jgi:sigma-B regulation protein RsbU (phosphoserine phosphatase)